MTDVANDYVGLNKLLVYLCAMETPIKPRGVQISGRAAQAMASMENRMMRLGIKPNGSRILRAALASLEASPDEAVKYWMESEASDP